MYIYGLPMPWHSDNGVPMTAFNNGTSTIVLLVIMMLGKRMLLTMVCAMTVPLTESSF